MTFGEIVMQAHRDLGRTNVDQSKILTPLQVAYNSFWRAAPWPESLGGLQPFFLSPHREFYGPPWVNFPSDFHYLWEAEMKVLTESSSRDCELRIAQRPAESKTYGTPEHMSFDVKHGCIAFDRVMNDTSGDKYHVAVTYKRYPLIIDRSTLDTVNFPLAGLDHNFLRFFTSTLRVNQNPEIELRIQQGLVLESARQAGIAIHTDHYRNLALDWSM